MVQINGTSNFVVYELDTQKSAMSRLAAQMKTIPKYLYFPDGVPDIDKFREKDGNITVENLLKIIISNKFGIDFIKLFETVNEKLSQQKLDLKQDVFLPFIVFNNSFTDTDSSHIFLSISNQITDANLFDKDNEALFKYIVKEWEIKNRNKTIKNISDLVASNIKESNAEKSMFDEFETIDIGINYTKFQLESVDFTFVLDLKDVTIMELFNNLHLNSNMPFACINSFFKILKGFIPPEGWRIYLPYAIIFRILQKKELAGVKPDDYTQGTLYITEENEIKTPTVSMSLLTSGQYLSREALIDRFIGNIKGLGNIEVNSINDTRVNGVFYFTNHDMNKYVLYELIMNNPLFSSLISIDESDKASTKKGSVYIHFYNSEIGKLTANITEKISERTDPDLRGKDKGAFKIGTKYIRVKIVSADNIKSVEAFQLLASKLMVLYDKKYKEIVDFYKIYIPDFADNKIKTAKDSDNKVESLKDIEPDVFVTGYPQRCPYEPTIIADDDYKSLKEAEKDGKIIMRYPKKGDNFQQRNYICNYEDYKYPGLRSNPLKNRDKIPYLPCCYKKNHATDEGNIYRHYYFGEELKDKAKTSQQGLIVTNKFVTKDTYGTLPDNIEKLFKIFDFQENEEYMYVRKGVLDTKSSFLECVMEGMHEESGILDYEDNDERENYLYEVRKILSTASLAATCRQEMYDYSTDKIIADISDPEVYMSPNLFTSLLEQYFNCNIFVFNRTNNRNGELSIPRHLQAYYKNKRKNNCIFIYEHMGSAADDEKYTPGSHCELIVKWKIDSSKQEDLSYSYPYESKVSQGVIGIFNRMTKAYSLNLEITETEFPIKIKFFEQGIDCYGKCRMLRFKYNGAIGTLLTDPMQPLSVPEVKEWVATKISKNLAKQFFAQYLNGNITSQTILRTKVKEIYGKIGTVNISIPIEDNEPIDGVSYTNKCISYPENQTSVIDNHNKYRKLARYIVEYMFWMFSNYIKEDITRTMDLTTIKKFVEDKIKIDEDFDYKHVGKIFRNDSGVMDDNKLVIKSMETLKRLIYTLRLAIVRSDENIRNYYKKQAIESYYVDVTDFDHHPMQIILHGDESVDKWIQEQKIKYVVNHSVQVGVRNPYFFQNSLIDNQIYLAQNTENLQKAREVGETWMKSGFNIQDDAVGSSKAFKFKLYSYINSKNIVLHNIKGVSTPYDISILGYKVDGVSFFTVLLQLF